MSYSVGRVKEELPLNWPRLAAMRSSASIRSPYTYDGLMKAKDLQLPALLFLLLPPGIVRFEVPTPRWPAGSPRYSCEPDPAQTRYCMGEQTDGHQTTPASMASLSNYLLLYFCLNLLLDTPLT